MWLFAVDAGNGLTPRECEAIFEFHARGGGILVARDHLDLGASLSGIRCLGPIEHFHRLQPEADEQRRWTTIGTRRSPGPTTTRAGTATCNRSRPSARAHPLLFRDGQSAAGGLLAHFPAHPHEGAIAPPPDDPNVRVVARGTAR